MAVFFGPRQTTASPRFASRKPRLMQRRLPVRLVCSVLPFASPLFALCASCTGTDIHPPGASFTFEVSMPKKRGIEGPVRSMSRTPTLWPWRDKVRASCDVTLDLPTPPLPDNMRMISLIPDNDISLRITDDI